MKASSAVAAVPLGISPSWSSMPQKRATLSNTSSTFTNPQPSVRCPQVSETRVRVRVQKDCEVRLRMYKKAGNSICQKFFLGANYTLSEAPLSHIIQTTRCSLPAWLQNCLLRRLNRGCTLRKSLSLYSRKQSITMNKDSSEWRSWEYTIRPSNAMCAMPIVKKKDQISQ